MRTRLPQRPVGGAGNDLLGHASPSQLKQQQGMVGCDSHHRNGPSGHLRWPRRRTFGSLARINRELIGKAVALDSPQRVVLYMDSTEIPVHGHQEPGPGRGEFHLWFGRNLSSSKQLCRRRGPAGIQPAAGLMARDTRRAIHRWAVPRRSPCLQALPAPTTPPCLNPETSCRASTLHPRQHLRRGQRPYQSPIR